MKSVGPNPEQTGFQGIGREMAERLGLGREVRQLKLGPTFTNDRTTSFHTLKYDFKPASVDVSKMASVDVGPNNTMTVTVPHLDGAGIPHTVFKGSQRPYSKECVLIIDRTTGEITLERLSSNIQVKKTRVEQKSQASLMANPSSNNLLNRPNTPVEYKKSPTHGRSTSRTKVASGKKREPTVQLPSKLPPPPPAPPQHQSSPMRASPYHGKSPSRINNSPAAQSSSMMQHSSTNLLASLPMIGSDFDDFHTPPVTVSQSLPPPSFTTKINQERSINNSSSTVTVGSTAITSTTRENDVGVLSDSSTTSSSSDSSDSDSEPENIPVPSVIPTTNGHINGNNNTSSPSLLNMPDNLLNDDLQLSESESDSD